MRSEKRFTVVWHVDESVEHELRHCCIFFSERDRECRGKGGEKREREEGGKGDKKGEVRRRGARGRGVHSLML